MLNTWSSRSQEDRLWASEVSKQLGLPLAQAPFARRIAQRASEARSETPVRAVPVFGALRSGDGVRRFRGQVVKGPRRPVEDCLVAPELLLVRGQKRAPAS